MNPSWRRTFTSVWAANFITAVGMMAFLPLFPLHLQELGVADEPSRELWSGLLAAGAPLTAALMGPVWGALGDRVGRKPMMLRANVAIALFTALMYFARSPWQLLVLRLLQGCFSGFIAPAMTLVSVAAAPERQGRIAGLLHTSVLAGNIVGPALGGAIGDHWSHRVTFLLCAALSILALLTIELGVAEPDVVRVAGRAGTKAAAALREAFAEARAFLAPGPLRSMVAGVFAVRVGGALPEAVLAIFVGMLAGAPPDHPGLATGVVYVALAAATLIAAPIWGRVADERGAVRVLIWCAFGAALTLVPQAFVGHVAPLWFLRFGTGVFLAGILPSAYGIAAQLSTVERRGAANGFMFSAIGLANAVGPLFGGALAAVAGVRVLFVAAGVLVFAGGARLAWKLRGAAATLAVAALLLALGCATGNGTRADAAEPPWRPLFDGVSLAGWRVVESGAAGAVEVVDRRLLLGQGEPMTAVVLAEPAASAFPRDGYELELVAARLLGNDFFAGLTFPVGAGELTLILGGWGGGLCGLSCLDREDAARNETKSFRGFERGRDYTIRVQVGEGRVRASVDGETIADVVVTGRRCSLRTEVEPCRPLGLASYQTKGAVRGVRWRPLPR